MPAKDAMPYRVLILSSDADDVRILRQALGSARDGPFVLEDAPTLVDGLHRIHGGRIDAILVDLLLPDRQGLACFDRLYAAARHTPILILCGLDNEADAIEAVQRGAQGWLSKGFFDNYLVPQSLRNIIERMKVERGLYVAQARTEITLNSIGDAVVSVDLAGRVDYLNIAAELVCGWSREEARGRPVAKVIDLVDADSGRTIASPIDDILYTDQPASLSGNAILVSRQGRRIPIEDSAAPIHDWDSQLVGAVMVFRDISDTVALTTKMQPKVDLQTDCITGVEALLRWKHPEWGLVMPERFVSIAEECGLIVPIGR